MSTGNDNQPLQPVPPPSNEETDRTTNETEQTREAAMTPSPGMATHPNIKNN